MIKTSRSPLLLAAVFFALRGFLPMAASEIIGNGTYPNSMDGRKFWSTIPMPVMSHFAGEKSRESSQLNDGIAERQRMSITHALVDSSVSRRLLSYSSVDSTCMKTSWTETETEADTMNSSGC